MREIRNACNILVGRPDVQRPLSVGGRLMSVRVCVFRTSTVAWIRLAQTGTMANSCEHSNDS
jgi:hypothetical protein